MLGTFQNCYRTSLFSLLFWELWLMITYVIIHVVLRRGVILGVGVHVRVVGQGPPVTVTILRYYGRAECRRLQQLQGLRPQRAVPPCLALVLPAILLLSSLPRQQALPLSAGVPPFEARRSSQAVPAGAAASPRAGRKRGAPAGTWEALERPEISGTHSVRLRKPKSHYQKLLMTCKDSTLNWVWWQAWGLLAYSAVKVLGSVCTFFLV